MARAEIAVSGLGLVTPGGVGVGQSWEAALAGRPAAALDPALKGGIVRLSCRVPEFDAEELLGARRALRLDPFVQFALVAAREAVADAGLDPATWDGARVGVVLGCADGGPGTVETQHRVLLHEGPTRVSPLVLPMQLPNMLAGQAAIEFGATGPNLVVATACASGATAIGTARDLLLLDRCDIVLAGGSEAMITPLVMAGFARMGALSRREDDPATASRPFDADRDGFVAGEGAGVVVLERAADARARGARVRALIMRLRIRRRRASHDQPASWGQGCRGGDPDGDRGRGSAPAGRPARQRARHLHPAQRSRRGTDAAPGAPRHPARQLDQGRHGSPPGSSPARWKRRSASSPSRTVWSRPPRGCAPSIRGWRSRFPPP